MGTDVKTAGQQQRGWLRRHWLLAILGVIAMFVALAAVAVGILYAVFLKTFTSLPPYKMALEEVQKDPKVIAALGEPIKDQTWLPGGTIHMENDRGEAGFSFTAAGPKAKADVWAEARRVEGKWALTKLEVTPKGAAVIKVPLEASGEEAPPFVPGPAVEKGPTGKEKEKPDDMNIDIPVPKM
jgi:hypothetical protein